MTEGRTTSQRAALVLGNCYFDHRRDFEDFPWNVLQIGEAFERALNEAGFKVIGQHEIHIPPGEAGFRVDV